MYMYHSVATAIVNSFHDQPAGFGPADLQRTGVRRDALFLTSLPELQKQKQKEQKKSTDGLLLVRESSWVVLGVFHATIL